MTISSIKDLAPAETLLLLQPYGNIGRRAMKLTLFDLMIKGVLVYESDLAPVVKPGQEPDPVHFLRTGPAFAGFRGADFEEVFLAPFRQGFSRMQIGMLKDIVVKQTGGPSGYKKKYLRQSPRLAPFFLTGFWSKLDSYALNQEGRNWQKKLKEELSQIRQKIKVEPEHSGASMEEGFILAGSSILLVEEVEEKIKKQEFSNEIFESFGEIFELLNNLYDGAIGEALSDAWDQLTEVFGDSDAGTDASGSFDGGSDGADGGSDGGGGGCSGGCSGCGS